VFVVVVAAECDGCVANTDARSVRVAMRPCNPGARDLPAVVLLFSVGGGGVDRVCDLKHWLPGPAAGRPRIACGGHSTDWRGARRWMRNARWDKVVIWACKLRRSERSGTRDSRARVESNVSGGLLG